MLQKLRSSYPDAFHCTAKGSNMAIQLCIRKVDIRALGEVNVGLELYMRVAPDYCIHQTLCSFHYCHVC